MVACLGNNLLLFDSNQLQNYLLVHTTTGSGSLMRLVSSDGTTPNVSDGNLQMFINNEWVTLCYSPSETDMVDAACKLLGYPGWQDLRFDLNNQ